MRPQTTSPDVQIDRRGRVGLVLLSRPQAINALTTGMVRVIDEALHAWKHDPQIECVLLAGEGERGFCAGGDVVRVREAIVSGRLDEARAFWRAEYTLNAHIARYPKPVVTFMDGIVMGGGVGLGCHASHRLVTERAKVAMPEVGIGLAPDVGGAYLLARAPGELGTHLALTGAAVGGHDAIACGLADRIVDPGTLDDVLDHLARHATAGLLDELSEPPGGPPGLGTLLKARAWIDAAYASDSVDAILAGLRAREEHEAHAAADIIATRSPHAVKVTLEAVRRARHLSLEACLDQDYRVSCAFLTAHDFAEGVRSVVVDKDRQPRWRPEALEDVTWSMVARHFAPVSDELGLGPSSAAQIAY